MLWKCMVSTSNHCEVDRQRSSTGTGVCNNSIESATPTNRKFRWLDSWALWVWCSLSPALFFSPLCRRATTRCDRRPGARASQGSTRFATLYADVYWRQRRVSERDGLFENRTAKIDSLKMSPIRLLYYWITMYVIFCPHLATLPLLVCCS